MSFVKLDAGILTSTLWGDLEGREVFITALLMAMPYELEYPVEALAVRTLEPLGFTVPVGWYGFVAAAGVGIVHASRLDAELGLVALERLGAPDPESRTPDFEGRRLVRVDGGYIVLNYMKYRDKDHTAKDRMKRFRARKKAEAKAPPVAPALRQALAPALRNETAHGNGVTRNVTHSRGKKAEVREQITDAEAIHAPARGVQLPCQADPKADRIRAVLADTRAHALGLATPEYAAELLGSLGPLAFNVDAETLEVGLREAIADIPAAAPESFWRKMLRTYVKQLAGKPPGERDHAKLPKPRRARRGPATEPEPVAALMSPAQIAKLAKGAAGAVKGDA